MQISLALVYGARTILFTLTSNSNMGPAGGLAFWEGPWPGLVTAKKREWFQTNRQKCWRCTLHIILNRWYGSSPLFPMSVPLLKRRLKDLQVLSVLEHLLLVLHPSITYLFYMIPLETKLDFIFGYQTYHATETQFIFTEKEKRQFMIPQYLHP